MGAKILLIDISRHADQALAVMQELGLAAPKDPELILKAMRAGAREFVVLDDAKEIVRVVAEAAQRARSDQPSGLVVSLFPAKGGSGATAIATGLAGLLREGGKRVVVV